MTVPTPERAAALLAEVADAEARVRRQSGTAHSGFLLVLGLASAGYLLAIPTGGTDRAVLAATVVFVPALIGASLGLVWGDRTGRRGLDRRFTVAMAAWAVAFSVGLSVGLSTTLPWWSWVAAAACSALPCLVGAWRELPR